MNGSYDFQAQSARIGMFTLIAGLIAKFAPALYLAGVLGVMHAFGGPQGNLAAPGWGLALLGAAAAACVGALLATAALLVEDVRGEGAR